ncbi:nuclear transport factor 2 family protein [Mumia sp. DW29H23]|uniref:nuclear transport factor 2 family protein n=1 Tax=Mumia sp. DW29H23 TaxID=3421241 RepID=UPI003D680C6F
MTNDGTRSSRSAREVAARYHQAMRDMSAEDLADLYAEDAVHEFPFASPGFPDRFEGREAVREGYRAAWGASAVEVESLEDVTVLVAEDPSFVVVEQVVVARTPSSGTDQGPRAPRPARGERSAPAGPRLHGRVRGGRRARSRRIPRLTPPLARSLRSRGKNRVATCPWRSVSSGG